MQKVPWCIGDGIETVTVLFQSLFLWRQYPWALPVGWQRMLYMQCVYFLTSIYTVWALLLKKKRKMAENLPAPSAPVKQLLEGHPLVGHPLTTSPVPLMAPSEGVRLCPPCWVWEETVTCVGVRDWLGSCLNLSIWTLTSGLLMAGKGALTVTGLTGISYTTISSLSERSRDRVELHSEMEDRERRVRDVDGSPRNNMGSSFLKIFREGGLVLLRGRPARWKMLSRFFFSSLGGSGSSSISSWHFPASSRSNPKPAAARTAPQPSKATSHRLWWEPLRLRLLVGVSCGVLVAEFTGVDSSLASLEGPSQSSFFWNGMQRYDWLCPGEGCTLPSPLRHSLSSSSGKQMKKEYFAWMQDFG